MDASRSLLDLLRPNTVSKERNVQEGPMTTSKGISEVQSNFLSILMGKPGDSVDKTTTMPLKQTFQSEYISNLIESKNEGLLKDMAKKERSLSSSGRLSTSTPSATATSTERISSSAALSTPTSLSVSSPVGSITPSHNGLLSILLTDPPSSDVGKSSSAQTVDTSATPWTTGTTVAGSSLESSADTPVSVPAAPSVPSASSTTASTTPIVVLSANEKTPKTLFTATNIFDQLSVTNPRMSDLKPKKILKAPPRTNESCVSRSEGGNMSLKNPSDHYLPQKLNLKKESDSEKVQGIRKIVFPDTPFMRLVIPFAKNVGFYDKVEVSEIARLVVGHDLLNNHTIDADKNYLAYVAPKDGSLRLMNQDDGSNILLSGQAGLKIHDLSFSKYPLNSDNTTYLMSTNSKGGVIVWNILKTSFSNPSKAVKMIFRLNGENSMSNTETRAKFCPLLNIIAIKLLNRIYFFKFSSDRFDEVQRYEISLSSSNIGFIVAEKFIEDFSFSPDGRVLVTIHEDGTAELWVIYEHIEHNIKFVISTPTLSYAVSNEPLCWVSFIGSKRPNTLSKQLVFGLRNNRKFYLLDLDSGSICQELILTGNSENSNSEMSSVAIYDNDSQNLIVNDYFGFLYQFHYNNKDLDTFMTQDSYIQSLVYKNTPIDVSAKNWSLFDSFYIVNFISKRTLYNFNVLSSDNSALDLFTAHDKGYTILHFPVLKHEITEELTKLNIHAYTAQSVVIFDDSNTTTVKASVHNKELSTEQKIAPSINFQNTFQDSKQESVKITKRRNVKIDDIFSTNKKETPNIGESTETNLSPSTLNVDDNSYSISDQTNLKKFIKVFLSNEFNKQNKKIDEFLTLKDEIRINQEKLLFQVSEKLNNNAKELIEKNVASSMKNIVLPVINKSSLNTTDKQTTQLIPYLKKISQELTSEIHNVNMKYMDKTNFVRDISQSLEKMIVNAVSSEIESSIKGSISQLQTAVFQKISELETKYDEKIDSLLKCIREKEKDFNSIEVLLKNISSLEKQVSVFLSKMNDDNLNMGPESAASKSLGNLHKSKEEVKASMMDLLAKTYYNDVLAAWVQSPYKAELFDMCAALDPKVMLGNASYIILFSVANSLSEIVEDLDDPLMEKKLQWLEVCLKLLMGMEKHNFSGIALQILILIENRMDSLYERLRRIVPKVSYLRIVLSILHFAGELRQFFNE
ncbi:hypothetical protein PCANB_001445 [Pneumocystis canis]|nr:hypothetical protein PCANB_001445 [Pneumocystis canis]